MLTVTPLHCPATETAAMTGMKCHHWDKQSQRDKVSEGGDGDMQHIVSVERIAPRLCCDVVFDGAGPLLRHFSVSDVAPVTNTPSYTARTGATEGETPTKKHRDQTNRTTKGSGPLATVCFFFLFFFFSSPNIPSI